MANALGGYDLTIFAQEALIYLEKLLGLGSRVYGGYSPSPSEKGRTITIAGPSSFTVQNAPSTAQDFAARQVDLKLNNWKEVKFALPDDEGQFSRESIMTDHIQPAVWALANDVNSNLAALYKTIPWAYDFDGSTSATSKSSITHAKQIMRENGVNFDGMVHLAMSEALEADLTALDWVSAANAAGATGEAVLVDGAQFRRFGINFFANSQIKTHTSGTVVSGGNDNVGAVDLVAGYDIGDTTVHIDGLSGSETVVAGDSFVFAGHSQRYTVTATTTLGTGEGDFAIYPALKAAVADGEVVTFEAGASSVAESYYANMLFHRNAFALGTAPLQSHAGSVQARQQGIQVETATSDSISMRARMWYDPDNSRNIMAFDLLYGVKTLDPNMAVNLRVTT